MRMWQQVGPGLYRLNGRIGGYALVHDGRCLLVDAPAANWTGALAELGVERADWILATHHHRDTLDGARPLSAAGAQVLAPAGDAERIAHAREFWQTARTYVLYDCDSRFSGIMDDVPVAQAVQPGQTVQAGPWRATMLPLRGHTRNHAGWLVEHAGRRIAFVGDAIERPGVVHNWCDFHWDYMDFNKGHLALLADLDGLEAARPDLLCPAHGRPIERVADALAALRANLRRFADLVEPNRIPRQRDEVYAALPHVWLVGQTCYGIVADDGACLLWDPGYPEPTRPRLEDFIARAGVTRIEAIAFSHYHDDHCWRATEVAQGFSGRSHEQPPYEVWAHRILADIFTRPGAYRLPCLIPDPMHIDRVFDDEPFEFHGIPMQYIFLPGQTWWHAGLVAQIDGRRVAFTGDNIWRPQTKDRPMMGPVMSRNRYLPGWTHQHAARRLLELDVNTIVPAHGEVFDVTRADLERYRDWADQVAEAVRALAGHGRVGVDCWWCRVDPFHLYVRPGETHRVRVVIDSPFDEPARIRVRLLLPAGFHASAMQDGLYVRPGEQDGVELTVQVPREWPAAARMEGRPVRMPYSVDLVVDDQAWPAQAEGLIIPRTV